jgi:hypothetical protein
MSSIQDVSAEQLATVFHRYLKALSHDGNGHGNGDGSSSWDPAPQDMRKLMLMAARLALIELATTPAERRPRRKYYAEPGQAEWGS